MPFASSSVFHWKVSQGFDEHQRGPFAVHALAEAMTALTGLTMMDPFSEWAAPANSDKISEPWFFCWHAMYSYAT
jgi:hypothetical protein